MWGEREVQRAANAKDTGGAVPVPQKQELAALGGTHGALEDTGGVDKDGAGNRRRRRTWVGGTLAMAGRQRHDVHVT